MSARDDLFTAQRDFARFVTAADEDADPLRSIVGRVRSDRAIPALARLRVYSNAWFERIHGALREDFGALHAALGDDAFHDLVKLYLMAFPPRSFSLRFAGEQLAEFLAGPVADVFTRCWPFAADLAALEWALTDVFDAPDAPALERSALAEVPPESWPELRFELVPAQRRLQLRWPVQRMRDAWSAGQPLPELRPSATSVLVRRHHEHVYQRALSPLEADALELVGRGADFAAICASVAAASDEPEGARRVLGLLECWLAEGLLRAPSPASSAPARRPRRCAARGASGSRAAPGA